MHSKLTAPSITHRCQGFTLIELIIGIGLGIVVLGGVIAVYIPSIQSWRTTSALAELQDTEFILHDVFSNAIRQAGMLACEGGDKAIIDGIDSSVSRNLDNINKWAFPDGLMSAEFMQTPFQAFAAGDNTLITAQLGLPNRLADTGDVFYTLTPNNGYYRVNSSTSGENLKTLTLSSSRVPGIQIRKGSFYIINDCDNPIIVMADRTTGNGTLDYRNGQINAITHPPQTVVNEFEPAIYYIGLFAPDSNDPNTTVPTLYKRTIVLKNDSLRAFDRPIVTGVENIRIQYGLAENSSGESRSYVVRYVTANNVPASFNLNNVRTVKVTAMIQSSQANNNVKQTAVMFPDNDASNTQRNCTAATASNYPAACPSSITSAAGKRTAHKVISFVYILPRPV